MPAPRDPLSADKARQALTTVYGSNRFAHLLTPYEHHDGRMIVMQWFRQHPRERAKTLAPEQARELCERFAASMSA